MFVHFNFVKASTLQNFLTPKFSRSTVLFNIINQLEINILKLNPYNAEV